MNEISLSGLWNLLGSAVLTSILVMFVYAALEYQERIRQRRNGRLETECQSLRNFANASAEGFVLFDLHTELIFVNSAFCQMMGVANPNDLLHHFLTDYCPAQDARHLTTVLIPAVLEKEELNVEDFSFGVNSAILPCRQSLSLVRGREGIPLAIAGTFRIIKTDKIPEGRPDGVRAPGKEENYPRGQIEYVETIRHRAVKTPNINAF